MRTLLPVLVLPLIAATPATEPVARMSGTAEVGDRLTLADGIVVQPARIIEDSRCPQEVLCVWAGRLIVEVSVSYDGKRTASPMGIGDAVHVAGGKLELVSAPPRKMAMDRPEDYRLGFAFKEAEPE